MAMMIRGDEIQAGDKVHYQTAVDGPLRSVVGTVEDVEKKRCGRGFEVVLTMNTGRLTVPASAKIKAER